MVNSIENIGPYLHINIYIYLDHFFKIQISVPVPQLFQNGDHVNSVYGGECQKPGELS
jgi:hypothetical protein